MTEQWWALLTAKDFCVGQVLLPADAPAPKRRDATVKFKYAVRVARAGLLMTEDIVVDREAGTGTWKEHAPSVAAVDAFDRRDRRVAEIGFDAWLKEEVARLVAEELARRADA